ncbi:MAG: cupin domain-containing protein [Actinomycetes bacterium]
MAPNGSIHRKSAVAVLAAALAVLSIAGSTASSAQSSGPSSGPSSGADDSRVVHAPAPAVPPIVLLTKQNTTVLGQPFTYPTEATAEVSSVIITLLPGQQTGMHRHDAPMYAYVLTGVLTVTYEGGIVRTYRKGQAIMEAIGVPHNGQNLGDEPIRVLVVNMGATGVANSVKL